MSGNFSVSGELRLKVGNDLITIPIEGELAMSPGGAIDVTPAAGAAKKPPAPAAGAAEAPADKPEKAEKKGKKAAASAPTVESSTIRLDEDGPIFPIKIERGANGVTISVPTFENAIESVTADTVDEAKELIEVNMRAFHEKREAEQAALEEKKKKKAAAEAATKTPAKAPAAPAKKAAKAPEPEPEPEEEEEEEGDDDLLSDDEGESTVDGAKEFEVPEASLKHAVFKDAVNIHAAALKKAGFSKEHAVEAIFSLQGEYDSSKKSKKTVPLVTLSGHMDKVWGDLK